MGTLMHGASDVIFLRIKCQKATNIRIKINSNSMLKDFTEQLEELTGVPATSMVLLKGFPPKRISYNRSIGTVNDLELEPQDTLIVELGQNISGDVESKAINSTGFFAAKHLQPKVDNVSSLVCPSPPFCHGPTRARSLDTTAKPYVEGENILEVEVPLSSAMTTFNIPNQVSMGLQETVYDPEDTSNGLLMRRVVPADNSCLFTSVAFCLSDVEQISDNNYLRQVIAATVASDPEKYNEAFLGRSNDDYCNWIKMPDSWGGGIEVSILSEFYSCEITVVNIQSLSVSRFGEDKKYSQRMFLLYDGIHYDPLYMEMFTTSQNRKLFSITDTSIAGQALQLAGEAKRAHQFTDLKNFQLRCNSCNTLLKGNTEAQQHAKSTGHVDFSEIV